MNIASALFSGPVSSPKGGADPVVFIIDEDASNRDSLASMVDREGWQPETFASARSFLARPRICAPSCLILDVGLPDINGLDLQRSISAARSDMPIIFVAGTCDISMAVQAMKAGAIEFFTKPFDKRDLLDAIRSALEISREAICRETQLRALEKRYETLSRREREVMALVASGRMNKQVGGDLGISEITVKAHRGKAMQKMEASSLAHLVMIAARLGVASQTSGRYSAKQ